MFNKKAFFIILALGGLYWTNFYLNQNNAMSSERLNMIEEYKEFYLKSGKRNYLDASFILEKYVNNAKHSRKKVNDDLLILGFTAKSYPDFVVYKKTIQHTEDVNSFDINVTLWKSAKDADQIEKFSSRIAINKTRIIK